MVGSGVHCVTGLKSTRRVCCARVSYVRLGSLIVWNRILSENRLGPPKGGQIALLYFWLWNVQILGEATSIQHSSTKSFVEMSDVASIQSHSTSSYSFWINRHGSHIDGQNSLLLSVHCEHCGLSPPIHSTGSKPSHHDACINLAICMTALRRVF